MNHPLTGIACFCARSTSAPCVAFTYDAFSLTSCGRAGDLKPENFCLAEPSSSGKPIMESLRLIDFGLSQRVRGGQAIAGLAGASHVLTS